VTTDLEIIKSILVKDFDNFINKPYMPFLIKKEDKINELPFLQDDKWRRVRRILVPIFTSKKLRMMAPIVEEHCAKLRDELIAFSNAGESVNIWELFGLHTLGIILATGFGRDVSTTNENPLAKSAASLVGLITSATNRFSIKWLETILSHFPWSKHFIKYFVRRSVVAQSFDCLEEAAFKLIKDCRETMATTGNTAEDMLQYMLEAHNENEGTKSKSYLTNAEIVGSMVAMILASYNSLRVL